MPEFDVILFGATGFTGQLAAAYIDEQYGNKVKWAIAGRSKERLERVAGACASRPRVIIADSGDRSSLEQMVAQTRCVVSFAGPFARYGSLLVAVCASAGCDYCDITGEIAWVRKLIEDHDDTARASGARIVNLCGHDSVPWDLTTMVLARELRKAGETVASLDFWDEIRSAPSGGTIETSMDFIQAPRAKKSSLGYDPLLKTSDGTPTASKLTANNIKGVTKEADGKARGLFVMADVNANVVKRSNALLGYGESVVYREGQVFRTVGEARKMQVVLVLLYVVLKFPSLARCTRRMGWLPKPGDGPSKEEMEKGFLTVRGEARGTRGGHAKATLTFPTDPGYKDTARMAVEAGLALALDAGRIDAKGGVLTPASCQGEVLLERLLATGSTLQVEP